jgi:hypothetical protein
MLFDDFSIFLAKVIILGFSCLIIYNLCDYVFNRKDIKGYNKKKRYKVLEHMKKKNSCAKGKKGKACREWNKDSNKKKKKLLIKQSKINTHAQKKISKMMKVINTKLAQVDAKNSK